MANTAHVEILMAGVSDWNSWRAKNPLVQPDLSGLDVSRRDLFKINVYGYGEGVIGTGDAGFFVDGINFNRCILADLLASEADLREANLCDADVVRGDLSRAFMDSADLRGANFQEANLSSVDLSTAKLFETNFVNANLQGCNLPSDLGGSNFAKADLRRASLPWANILTAKDFSGSVILDSTRVRLSRFAYFREHFSKAPGYEHIIWSENDKAHNKATIPKSCFISYSSNDIKFVEKLCYDLKNEGVKVWFAPRDMPIGGKIRQSIDLAIRTHQKLLLILSESSISSSWVEAEVEAAIDYEWRNQEPIVFPIRLDDSILTTSVSWAAHIRRQRHIGDFTKWTVTSEYKAGLGRLLRDLAKD